MKKSIIALITSIILVTGMMPVVFAVDNNQGSADNNQLRVGNNQSAAVKKLTAPKKVIAKATGWNKITVKWSKCKSATGYKIYYYSIKKKTFLPYREVKSNSCTIKGVKPGRKYYFKIKAFEYSGKNKLGESTFSSVASAATRLYAPAKVKASAKSDNSIVIKWSKVKEASGYAVLRYRADNKKFYCIGTVSSGKRSFTDKRTGLNKKYYYKVRAFSIVKKTVKKKYNKNGKTKVKAVVLKVRRPGALSKIASAKTKTYRKKLMCKVTAYCDSGFTASGMRAGRGRVAVDPNVISLGSRMYVSGYGNCIAADTGGAVKGNFIDIWLPSESACSAWGVRYKMVYVY